MTTVSWRELLEEAEQIIEHEPFMSPILNKFVLNQNCFADSICSILAHQFAGIISEEEWRNLFLQAFYNKKLIGNPEQQYEPPKVQTLTDMGLQDLSAVRERDPACDRLIIPLLNFKGYKAIQAHRIAHVIWRSGAKDTARAIQSRASELYAVDIHPAAKIGSGLMIDHGTGVVIGETAVIGDNCSFLHGVTLGSTGKEVRDRHPKVGNGVLIGCNATLLGNIVIGDSCKIGSGSIVLKSLPCGATAVGNPARIVGRSMCPSAALGMDHALFYVETGGGTLFRNTWSITADGSCVFQEVDTEKIGLITVDQAVTAYTLRFNHEPNLQFFREGFAEVDADHDGMINIEQFETLAHRLASLEAAGLSQEKEWVKRTGAEWSNILLSASLAGSSL